MVSTDNVACGRYGDASRVEKVAVASAMAGIPDALRPEVKVDQGFVAGCLPLILGALGGLFVFVAVGSLARPLFGAPQNNPTLQWQLWVQLLLGVLFLLGAYLLRRPLGKKEEEAEAVYRHAMARWGHAYWCPLHDIVFIPGEGREVPLTHISRLLYPARQHSLSPSPSSAHHLGTPRVVFRFRPERAPPTGGALGPPGRVLLVHQGGPRRGSTVGPVPWPLSSPGRPEGPLRGGRPPTSPPAAGPGVGTTALERGGRGPGTAISEPRAGHLTRPRGDPGDARPGATACRTCA